MPTRPTTATPMCTCGWPNRVSWRSGARTTGLAGPLPQRHRRPPGCDRVVPAHCRYHHQQDAAGRCLGVVLDTRRHVGASGTWSGWWSWTRFLLPISRQVPVGLCAPRGVARPARNSWCNTGYRAADVGRSCETTLARRTGSTPPPSPSGRSVTMNALWTREAIAVLDKLDDPWGLAVCNVPAGRRLGDPRRGRLRPNGCRSCPRAGDRHVLGLALTQIAQIAVAGDEAAAAAWAAVRSARPSRRIGYTEGIVSALHVLARPSRLSVLMQHARHHRRALGLASRIGHATAMCEAAEDFAHDEVVDRPDVAPIVRAAQAERDRRPALRRPRRTRVRRPRTGTRPRARRWPGARPFSDLVAEMAQ